MAARYLRKFTDPDFLSTIAPSRLAAFLVPWRSYLQARGVDFPEIRMGALDCAALAHVLMTPDASTPVELIDALYYVHESSSDEHMEALLDLARSRDLRIEHDPNTSAADVAIQVWLVQPDILREHHAEAVAFRQKTFDYYGGAHGVRQVLPHMDEECRRRIEATIDEWMEKHRRGGGCRVFLFPREEKLWILVRHGLTMRREAGHRDDGEPETEFYRPQQHDVLIYDANVDEVGIHAGTKGEKKLYLACFGRNLFGDERYFPSEETFTLDPLIEDGPQSLACQDIDGLEEIRLTEIRRYWGGAHKEIEVRRATDIFDAYAARGGSLAKGARLLSATFSVRFSDSTKERSVTIRPPNNAKFERNEDSELVDMWLRRRGFASGSGLEHKQAVVRDATVAVA